MKKSILFTCLFLPLFSANANNCGNLNVSIFNRSGHTCLLRTTTIQNGAIIFGQAPQLIENGEKTPLFTIQQSYTMGPSVQLEYVCDNKSVSIKSRQNMCIIYAGFVSGDYTSSNNVQASYTAKEGSWWSTLPGEIDWTIY